MSARVDAIKALAAPGTSATEVLQFLEKNGVKHSGIQEIPAEAASARGIVAMVRDKGGILTIVRHDVKIVILLDDNDNVASMIVDDLFTGW